MQITDEDVDEMVAFLTMGGIKCKHSGIRRIWIRHHLEKGHVFDFELNEFIPRENKDESV